MFFALASLFLFLAVKYNSFNLWGIVQFLIYLIKILVWIIRCSFLIAIHLTIILKKY